MIYPWANTRLNHGFFYLNFGRDFVSIYAAFHPWFQLCFFFAHSIRLPFELNTTVCCVAMAMVQMYIVSYALGMFCMVLSFYAGVIYYTKAILLDMKSIFNRCDELARSKDRSDELVMLTHFREMIDLHVRIYKYVPFPLSRISEIFSRFQFTQFSEFSFVAACKHWPMWWTSSFLRRPHRLLESCVHRCWCSIW